MPAGFVDLRSGPLIQGIDVSKYQDEADFSSVVHCGARFAFIRLSAGVSPDNELKYRTHWANARSSGLLPGGYHNLSVMPASAKAYLTQSPAAITAAVKLLIPTGVASAQKQADIYLSRLDEVISLDPVGLGTVYRLPTALDLSADPLAGGSADQKLAMGPLYQAMACAFIDHVEASGRTSEPVILYLSAATYHDYALSSANCHLERHPIWLRYHSENGDGYQTSGDPNVRSLCSTSSGRDDAASVPGNSAQNCIFEQYTSFGGFAVFKPGAGLDLSRFYGSDQDFHKLLVAEN